MEEKCQLAYVGKVEQLQTSGYTNCWVYNLGIYAGYLCAASYQQTQIDQLNGVVSIENAVRYISGYPTVMKPLKTRKQSKSADQVGRDLDIIPKLRDQRKDHLSFSSDEDEDEMQRNKKLNFSEIKNVETGKFIILFAISKL